MFFTHIDAFEYVPVHKSSDVHVVVLTIIISLDGLICSINGCF